MTAQEWKYDINKQLKITPEYLPAFDTTIEILAQILEERDRVYSEYLASGARPIITFESDRGAKNPKANPLLTQWQDLNKTALAYLRDLGLTAAGLRKLLGQLPEEREQKPNTVDDIREKYGIATGAPDDKTEGKKADKRANKKGRPASDNITYIEIDEE